MASTQMNVRIDEAVKAGGDAVFERLGYSPTRVIRIVWEYAALHAGNPDAVEELLREAEQAIDPSIEEEGKRLAAGMEQGLEIYQRYLDALGLSALPSSGLSDEELLEEAYRERARERGTA